MMKREVAHRIFSAEYTASNCIIEGTQERDPTYVVTPLGTKVNRLFVVGVLTEVTKYGEDDQPMYRAKVEDMTGTYFISAGQYQPEVAAVLSKMEPPMFVAVVGKVRIYRPEEDVLYLSIRPESIKEVTADDRNLWTLEACRAMRPRLEALCEAQKMSEPKIEDLSKIGFADKISQGTVDAISHYGDIDASRYRSILEETLRFLSSDQSHQAPVIPEQSSTPAAAPAGAMSKPKENIKENKGEDKPDSPDFEDTVLKVISKLDTVGKGAIWDDLVEACQNKKIKREQLDETVHSLLDKGLVYEPVLGKIKLI